jgi:multiple antibiotic resistance protein
MSFEASLFNSFLTLLVIVDPFGNVPIFLALTKDLHPLERKRTVMKSVFAATVMIVAFALVGEYVLEFFGVSTEAFTIAGGLLLLAIGFEMVLTGISTHSRQVEEAERESVYITPLATPLLAGPGSMTAGILLVQQEGVYVAVLAIALALALSLLVLLNCNTIFRIIGRDGTTVLSKIMGLLVAAIAVQMIVNGIVGVFPILGR